MMLFSLVSPLHLATSVKLALQKCPKSLPLQASHTARPAKVHLAAKVPSEEKDLSGCDLDGHQQPEVNTGVSITATYWPGMLLFY